MMWALLLVGGFAFGRTNADRTRRMPVWTRLGSSLALVVAAWLWYGVALSTEASGFALLIALGMTLGFIGDVALASVLPLKQPVLAGMAAFGLGHIAYIAGMLLFAGGHRLFSPLAFALAEIAWLLVGVAGWYTVVFRGRAHTALHWAALPYALLLASTAGVATGLASQHTALVPLVIGAALFLLSDLILAGQLFGGLRFPLISDAVWLTYGPAQALIVFSVGVALGIQG